MAGDRPPLPALPRGRHRLSREEVAASQRGRILDAMAHTVAERGYAATSVTDVVARAGVSTKAFYEQFSDKEDCFLATYDTGIAVLLEVMRAATVPGRGSPERRFERTLAAYLDALVAERAFARTFLIEVYAAGPRALERRREVQRRFTDAVAEIFEVPAGSSPRAQSRRFDCEALVGAISSLVTNRVAAGRYEELPALRAPVMRLVRRHISRAGARAGATVQN